MQFTTGGGVCVRLATGMSATWISVAQVRPDLAASCADDYLCSACARRFGGLQAHDLVVLALVCPHDQAARLPAPSRN
jgi:hypothetical protein